TPHGRPTLFEIPILKRLPPEIQRFSILLRFLRETLISNWRYSSATCSSAYIRLASFRIVLQEANRYFGTCRFRPSNRYVRSSDSCTLQRPVSPPRSK